MDVTILTNSLRPIFTVTLVWNTGCYHSEHIWDQLFTVDTIWNIGETGGINHQSYFAVKMFLKNLEFSNGALWMRPQLFLFNLMVI